MPTYHTIDSITTMMLLGITIVNLKDKLFLPINKFVHSETYNIICRF